MSSSISKAAAYGRLKLLEDTVDALTAARLYGAPADGEKLNEAIVHRRLLAARGAAGELRFPIWQFRAGGGVVDGFERVPDELSGSLAGEDMGAFAFFLNPNPLTDGMSPIEALRAGKFETVMLAAADAHF